MDERKISEDEQKEPGEEYSFLQEVIKDERSGKRLRSGILHMIALGFVFGIVACFSFQISKPWIENKLGGDPEQVTIPRDEEEETEEGTGKDSENGEDVQQTVTAPEERPVLDSESYRQMLQSLKDVARDSADSIVEITGLSEGEDWEEELSGSRHSVSGIIVADNGQELLILGRVCPVKNAERIRVTFAGGDRYEAVIKASDLNLGLSVYAVPRASISEETWTKIGTAVLGNSNLVTAGDTAIVLGKPFGYANAFTYGIISLDRADVTFLDGQYEVVYTDISGSEGASGVLVNMRGEVIAVVNQELLEEDGRGQIAGYGISDIKDVIERLSNGKSVPYIGIYGINVTEDMQGEGLPRGIYVKEVETDSPAMAAGIQNGDIIMLMDNIEIYDIDGYHNILKKKDQGDRVALKGCRQGAGGEYVDIDFSVTVGAKK